MPVGSATNMTSLSTAKIAALLSAAILVIAGCQPGVHTYRLSDKADPLGNKLFQMELKKQNVSFELSADGFYSAPPDQIEKLVAIGAEVSAKSRSRIYVPVDSGCSSKKMAEWLEGRKIIFVETYFEKKPVLELAGTSDDQLATVNKHFQFHLECVRAGAEARYTEIWKPGNKNTAGSK